MTEKPAEKETEKESEEALEAEETSEVDEETETSEKDQANKEQEDFKKKFYYLAAELENTRKRFEREKSNLLKFGNEKVLSQLIEVVDNLERTFTALEADESEKVKNIHDGIKMVYDQFVGVLDKNGLKQVKALGEQFDPNFHEAMAQQPAEGKEHQEVIMEYQRGYILNGRLLRAAKVIVANNENE